MQLHIKITPANKNAIQKAFKKHSLKKSWELELESLKRQKLIKAKKGNNSKKYTINFNAFQI